MYILIGTSNRER